MAVLDIAPSAIRGAPPIAEEHLDDAATREEWWTSVSVVLPCFNEEAAVVEQVQSIQRVLTSHGITHEIIVVDDGSVDGTSAEAAKTSARVLRHQRNRGYGASIKTGIRAAQYNTIVICDVDGTYPVDAIPTLVRKLADADMVVGARTGANVHIPLIRRPAKWFIRWLAEVIAGERIADINSGLRAFRRDVVRQYLPILSNRFSFTTTSTLALLADDYRVVYTPIDYYKRIGKSKITPRHALDFTVLVLRMAMMFQPLKIFVPLALLLLAIGLAKTVFDLWAMVVRANGVDWSLIFYPVLSTSAMLFLMTGFQVLVVGMLADAMVRRMTQSQAPLLPGRWLSAAHETAVNERELAVAERQAPRR